eukprot:scaffold1231_cov356-Pavlova_lutheri.AAC.1
MRATGPRDYQAPHGDKGTTLNRCWVEGPLEAPLLDLKIDFCLDDFSSACLHQARACCGFSTLPRLAQVSRSRPTRLTLHKRALQGGSILFPWHLGRLEAQNVCELAVSPRTLCDTVEAEAQRR